MLRRIGVAVAVSLAVSCEALAPCVSQSDFYRRRAELVCARYIACHEDEVDTTVERCEAEYAAGYESEAWNAGDRCGGTFDECEAGRCLVVFEQHLAKGYPLSGCELPDEYDDPCWLYSYWRNDRYDVGSCMDSVE